MQYNLFIIVFVIIFQIYPFGTSTVKKNDGNPFWLEY